MLFILAAYLCLVHGLADGVALGDGEEGTQDD